MWKSSHYIVASRIAHHYKLDKYQSLFLKIGSIVPDFKPTCYYKRHTRDNWESYTNRLLNRLTERNKTLLFYYDFGKLLHFYCDFYTRPHNTSSLKNFISNHINWERELDLLVKKYFILKVNNDLDKMRSRYNSENSNKVVTDLMYIQSICFYLCKEVGLSSV